MSSAKLAKAGAVVQLHPEDAPDPAYYESRRKAPAAYTPRELIECRRHWSALELVVFDALVIIGAGWHKPVPAARVVPLVGKSAAQVRRATATLIQRGAVRRYTSYSGQLDAFAFAWRDYEPTVAERDRMGWTLAQLKADRNGARARVCRDASDGQARVCRDAPRIDLNASVETRGRVRSDAPHACVGTRPLLMLDPLLDLSLDQSKSVPPSLTVSEAVAPTALEKDAAPGGDGSLSEAVQKSLDYGGEPEALVGELQRLHFEHFDQIEDQRICELVDRIRAIAWGDYEWRVTDAEILTYVRWASGEVKRATSSGTGYSPMGLLSHPPRISFWLKRETVRRRHVAETRKRLKVPRPKPRTAALDALANMEAQCERAVANGWDDQARTWRRTIDEMKSKLGTE